MSEHRAKAKAAQGGTVGDGERLVIDVDKATRDAGLQLFCAVEVARQGLREWVSGVLASYGVDEAKEAVEYDVVTGRITVRVGRKAEAEVGSG